MLTPKPTKLADLLREINAFAQAGGTSAQCERLTREADSLADMVGWAPGPIDPHGQWLQRLANLQDDLLQRYQRTNDLTLAVLNDTLTRLGRAIFKHDTDLAGNGDISDDTHEL